MRLAVTKTKFDTTSINTTIINVACIIVCVLLIAYNKTAMLAATKAFEIWLTAVMPALFPFFICTSIMQKNGIFESSKASPLVSIFVLFFASAISGAPSGARLMSNINERYKLDDGTTSTLTALCNMVSPTFIIGTVSFAMLGSIQYAIPIMIGHYLSSIILLTAYLFRNKNRINKCMQSISKPRNKPDSSKILIDSILASGVSILKIGGTIIFFMVFTEVINKAGLLDLILKPLALLGLRIDVLKSIVVGVLEMANGSYSVSQLSGMSHSLTCALICFVITFSGLCIMTQSMSFLRLNQKKYIASKLICAVLAFVLAYLASEIILPDSITTSGLIHGGLENSKIFTNNLFALLSIVSASILGVATIYLSCIIKNRKRMERSR